MPPTKPAWPWSLPAAVISNTEDRSESFCPPSVNFSAGWASDPPVFKYGVRLNFPHDDRKGRNVKANVGGMDRIFRIVVGLVLVALVFVGPQTVWGWVGVIPLATGLLQFCPLYPLVGLNTCPCKGEESET